MDVQPPHQERQWAEGSIQLDVVGALFDSSSWRSTVAVGARLLDHRGLDAVLQGMLDVYRTHAVLTDYGFEHIQLIDTCSAILLGPNARTQLSTELGGPQYAADFIAAVATVVRIRLGMRGNYNQRPLSAVGEALALDTEELLSHVEYPGVLEDAVARMCDATLTDGGRINTRRVRAMRQHFSPSPLAPRRYQPSAALRTALGVIRSPYRSWSKAEAAKQPEAIQLMRRLLGEGGDIPLSMRQLLAGLNEEEALLVQQQLITHINTFIASQEVRRAPSRRSGRRGRVGGAVITAAAAEAEIAAAVDRHPDDIWPVLPQEYTDLSYRQVVIGLLMVCGLSQEEGVAVTDHLLQSAVESPRLNSGLVKLANFINLYRTHLSQTKQRHPEYKRVFVLLDRLLSTDPLARTPYARLAGDSLQAPVDVEADLRRFLTYVLEWRLNTRTRSARQSLMTTIAAIPPGRTARRT